MNKKFPIRQGVACPLKWGWNTVRLSEATTACCHRVKTVPLDKSNFDDFHNYPEWINHREMMLNGHFPEQGCKQYCGDIEKHGGTSERLMHMNSDNMMPRELEENPLATRTTPKVLEVFINNSCNMACIYCDESNSSRIAKENKKFGYDVPGATLFSSSQIDSGSFITKNPKTENFDNLVDSFFSYLDKNYQHLGRLHVLGGEPFYQKEFYRLVDFISTNQNKELVFTVVSNLMVSKSILEEFVETMKKNIIDQKISRADITASIDCFGPEQEYVRYGLDLEQWKENFQYLAQHKWLYLTVNNTITSLTVKTLPDLLTYVNAIRKHRPIHHAFSLVEGRPHLHPRIFGSGFFDNDFERILQSMPTEKTWDKHNIDYMQGLIKTTNSSTVDLQSKRNLKHYLNEIDRRRATNWQITFPWLAEELTYVV
jgi:pyruvate-formate lyase-activating enzyme